MLYLLFIFWLLDFTLLFTSHLILVHYSYVHSKLSLLYFPVFYFILFHFFLLCCFPPFLLVCLPVPLHPQMHLFPYLMCSEICMKHYQMWDAVEGVCFNLKTLYLNMNFYFVAFILNTNIWRYTHASLYVSKLLTSFHLKIFSSPHFTYVFSTNCSGLSLWPKEWWSDKPFQKGVFFLLFFFCFFSLSKNGIGLCFRWYTI